MEEQRIGRLYLRLAIQRVQKIWNRMTGAEARRSALFPIMVILVVVILPGLIWFAHMHAKFHRLQEKMQHTAVRQPAGPQPGGRDPIILSRTQTPGSSMPEFLSVTLLPGLGMDVLQITAFLPERGEVPLLLAPTIQQMMDLTSLPSDGADDTQGAIEVPWSGSVEGVPSPVGTTMSLTWKGRSITMPTDPQGQMGVAQGGLLRFRDADSAQTPPAPNGTGATADFNSTDFDGHWFSRTQTTVSVSVEATAIDLKVDTKNVGDEPEPMGIGWHPRFAIQSGSRGQVMLRLPNAGLLDYGDKVRHTPTGKILSPGPELEPFIAHPAPLGHVALDEGLVHMKGGLMDAGPFVELRDAAAKYGMRLTAVSQSIQEMRVYAPADGNFIALGPQTNLDHALSSKWSGDESITTLQPGQTLEWRARLEIFPVIGGLPVH